jgi:hypothetical protein
LYLVLLLPPLLPKLVTLFLDNGSSSKEKNDNSIKKQPKTSGNANQKKTKTSVVSKSSKTQKANKNKTEKTFKTRASPKTKKTSNTFSSTPATSSVLEKIIPSRNDIVKNENIAVPKKSKKYSFLKLFLTDFVQSMIRDELDKKTNS